MNAGIVELDLHGKNRYQAAAAIDSALRRCGHDVYRLRLIHGYHQGNCLCQLIQEHYSLHPRVLRLFSPRPGVAELVLREY